MADSSAQDRTLPATPRRLEKAREEGQIATSRDLGHFAAIAGGGALLVAVVPQVAALLKDALARSLRFGRAQALGTDAMTDGLGQWAGTWLMLAVPFGVGLALVAVACRVGFGGWTWTTRPLVPKLSVLDPIGGISRLFSKRQAIDALKACVLALVLGAIGAHWLLGHAGEFHSTLGAPLPSALSSLAATIVGGLAPVVVALAAFAAVDAPLQKKLHADSLKMSREEVKQEHKELDGSAEVKAKVKTRMREMTRRRMLAAVPKADLVVMNPTHYAVALKYDEASMAAPRVVAKGADLLALRIRDTAQGAQVPVLQSPVLARALYAHAELDREIPAALFAAVAQVLAYVYQLRAALRGHGLAPAALPEVEVPAELDPHHVAAAAVRAAT